MTYVFDLDGTIIDSTDRHWMLMQKLLREHSIEVDQDFKSDFMRYKRNGNSGLKYLTAVMGLNKGLALMIQDEWIHQIEDDSWLDKDKLYDDAIQTLNGLNGDIIFLTIRDNRKGLCDELARLGIDKYKLIVLNNGESKAKELKKIEGKCIVVGDTEVDYNAAIEANCNVYILNRGFRSKAFWEKAGIESYKNLLQVFQLA